MDVHDINFHYAKRYLHTFVSRSFYIYKMITDRDIQTAPIFGVFEAVAFSNSGVAWKIVKYN